MAITDDKPEENLDDNIRWQHQMSTTDTNPDDNTMLQHQVITQYTIPGDN
jgi:hypothetical protein